MTTTISSSAMQHLNYQTGMFLTSAYMTLEQNYFSNWITLQNQYLYTPGVLGGMLVSLNNNSLSVAQGAGFDPLGNFLLLPGDSGNPVDIPSPAVSPFYVYALYPDNSHSTAPVVNQSAVVAAAAAVPANGVILATVTTSNGVMTVTDSRVGVTSRLPALAPAPAAPPATAVTPAAPVAR